MYLALCPARSPSALRWRELRSPVRGDGLAVLHPFHSGEGRHACLADQLDVLSHSCCHKRGLGFLQDGSERESNSTGTSAALLSSGSSNVTLDESQPQVKAGLAAPTIQLWADELGNMRGALFYAAKAALDRRNATIPPRRQKSPTTPVFWSN